MIRCLYRNPDREEAVLKHMRELAQEIDSRRLKV